MDYKKAYESIINRASARTILTEEYDVHHILPKSLGGTNKKENLVKLYLREHFICHLLLAKIYGGKMFTAAFMMSSNFRYNSKQYKAFREQHNERLTGDNNPSRRYPCTDKKRKLNSDQSKDRRWLNNGVDSCMVKGADIDILLADGWKLGRLMTESLITGTTNGGKKTGGHNKGIPCSDEQRKAISETLAGNTPWNKGIKMPAEFGEKISNRQKGQKQSNESNLKRSASLLGKKHPWQTVSNTKGKKWITNGASNKMVPADIVQQFIDLGWHMGISR